MTGSRHRTIDHCGKNDANRSRSEIIGPAKDVDEAKKNFDYTSSSPYPAIHGIQPG